MKENEQYQLHEKARKRIKQKKRLYLHFVLFLLGSILMVILNKVVKFKPEYDWFLWAIITWTLFLVLHAINVFIMDRFFGKEWIRMETEKLIRKHGKKVEELEKSLDKSGAFTSDSSENDLNS